MLRVVRTDLGACVASMVLIAGSVPVRAADWSVSSFLSLQASGDTALDDEDEDRLSTTGDLGALIAVTTPTSSYTFAPGLRGIYESGEDETLESILPRFNLGFRNSLTPLTGISGSFSFLPTPARDEQFDDTGETTSGGLQLTSSLQFGLSTQINQLNSINLGVDARRRDFVDTDSPDLVDNLSYGASLGWTHVLDRATSLTLTSAVTRFEDDDDDNSISYSLSGGAQHQLAPNLTLGGTLGVSAVDRSESSNPDASNFSLSPIGSLSLAYSGADYTVSLGLSQAVDQRSDSELVSNTSLSAGLRYDINQLSRFNLTASASNQTPLDGDSDDRRTLSITPSYAVSLTSDWEASAGYRLRLSDDDDGTGVSNGVFVQISRNFSLLP